MSNRRALNTIAVAGVLDVGVGVAFAAVEHISVALGLYWAVSTATTVGYGDVTPHTLVGHILSVLAMLTVIPLFAAAFSLLTSSLAGEHAHQEGEDLRRRIMHIVQNHPDIPDFPEKR